MTSPFASAKSSVGYVYATEGTEDKEYGRIGAAGVNSSGSVGDGDATCSTGTGIYGIIACAVVRDEFETGGEDVDQCFVEASRDLVGKSNS